MRTLRQAAGSEEANCRQECGARRGADVTPLLDRYFARLKRGQPWRWRGQVLESVGQTIESAGPPASVGECCEIQDQAGRRASGRGDRISRLECVVDAGGDNGRAFASAIRSGRLGIRPEIEVGPALMGQGAERAGDADRRRPAARGLDGAAPGRSGALAARPHAHSRTSGHRHPRHRRAC